MTYNKASCLKLPVELVREISSLCDRGPLASLAATHSHFRSPAQEFLYEEVAVKIGDNFGTRTMKLLKTLAENPELCGWIKSFGVVHEKLEDGMPLKKEHSQSVIDMLRTILQNAQRLRELRVLLYTEENDWVRGLEDIFYSSMHPHLRAMYFPLGVDYLQIIRAHPEMAMLGMFIPHKCEPEKRIDPYVGQLLREVKKITYVVDSLPSMPIIFAFRNEDSSDYFIPGYGTADEDEDDGLEVLSDDFVEEFIVFPWLVPHHAKDIFLDQVQDFMIRDTLYMKKDLETVQRVSIFDDQSLEADCLRSLSHELSAFCPGAYCAQFHLQHNYDMEHSEVEQILKDWSTNASEVHFKMWPDMDGKTRFFAEPLSDRVRAKLVESLGTICPNLFLGTIDGYGFSKTDGWFRLSVAEADEDM
ncbi:hypothetical protein CPC08DRAFT_264401 [Agrocybe pediades]|nr:hypothetical protein CPC08DRAFT_264401 [Agrocybe pediades]